MKKIAVLMTCYNRAETTLMSLRELYGQALDDGYSMDVWLVDDASPDGTGRKVKSEFPMTHVVQGTGGLYWCKGMRLAWDSAAAAEDYDFYLWLNDDTHLFPGALKCIMDDYEYVGRQGVEKRVVVGSFVGSPESDFITYGLERRGADGKTMRLVPNGQFPEESDQGFMAGNCVLVPRDVFNTVGPICNLYQHGFGDYDYALMLREHGIPFYSTSRVIGWCKANKSNFTFEGKNLWQRLSLLKDPKGLPLRDTWVMRVRHKGYLRALVSVVHVIFIAIRGKRLF